MKKKYIFAFFGALFLATACAGCREAVSVPLPDYGNTEVPLNETVMTAGNEKQTEGEAASEKAVGKADKKASGTAAKEGKTAKGADDTKGKAAATGKDISGKGNDSENIDFAAGKESGEEAESPGRNNGKKTEMKPETKPEAESGTETDGKGDKKDGEKAVKEAVRQIVEKTGSVNTAEVPDSGIFYLSGEPRTVCKGPGEDYGMVTDNGGNAVINGNCPVTLLGRTDNGWLHVSYVSTGAVAYQNAEPHTVEGYIPDGCLIKEEDYIAGLELLNEHGERVKNEVDKLIEEKQKEKEELKKKKEKEDAEMKKEKENKEPENEETTEPMNEESTEAEVEESTEPEAEESTEPERKDTEEKEREQNDEEQSKGE
ncbi:MAG: hypothetical protein K5879_02415 [Lachnospiraceae bacterium]|nr:hypothetical protein [Lachnospiraceae bacterium]